MKYVQVPQVTSNLWMWTCRDFIWYNWETIYIEYKELNATQSTGNGMESY